MQKSPPNVGTKGFIKILPIKARNQGSSLIEIGEVLKDFPLFTLDIVSFDFIDRYAFKRERLYQGN